MVGPRVFIILFGVLVLAIFNGGGECQKIGEDCCLEDWEDVMFVVTTGFQDYRDDLMGRAFMEMLKGWMDRIKFEPTMVLDTICGGQLAFRCVGNKNKATCVCNKGHQFPHNYVESEDKTGCMPTNTPDPTNKPTPRPPGTNRPTRGPPGPIRPLMPEVGGFCMFAIGNMKASMCPNGEECKPNAGDTRIGMCMAKGGRPTNINGGAYTTYGSVMFIWVMWVVVTGLTLIPVTP